MNKVTLICSHCNKEFQRYYSEHQKALKRNCIKFYCSKECQLKDQEADKIKVICPICKKEFQTFAYEQKYSKQLYCSIDCYNVWKKTSKKTILLKCTTCNKDFYITPGLYNKKQKRKQIIHFCSDACARKHRQTEWSQLFDVKCDFCSKPLKKRGEYLKKSKLHFCNRSCLGSYMSKIYNLGGDERSILEQRLQNIIKEKYPNLNIIFNDREVCYSMELDIYIPSLKLAFEINGPVHYKPIYGQEALDIITKKDQTKQKICHKKGIELFIIKDTINYDKDNSNQIFEDNIKPILEKYNK